MSFLKNIFEKVNDYIKNRTDSQNKASEMLNKGKTFTLNNMQSKRYSYDGDLGEYDPKNKKYKLNYGYSGLYTGKQISEGTSGGGFEEHNVDSTAIDHVTYNPETENLGVSFRSNPSKVYDFPGVPESLVSRFINAPSKGTFYHKQIKKYSTAI